MEAQPVLCVGMNSTFTYAVDSFVFRQKINLKSQVMPHTLCIWGRTLRLTKWNRLCLKVVLRLESFKIRGALCLIPTYCSLCYRLVRWYTPVKITEGGGAIFHTVLFYPDTHRAPAVLLPLCGHMGVVYSLATIFVKRDCFSFNSPPLW